MSDASTIMSRVATVVAAMAVTSQSGSPAQFKQWLHGDIETAKGDRCFTVEFTGGGDIDYQSLESTSRREFTFDLCVLYRNERKDTVTFGGLLADDISRIQQRVFADSQDSTAGRLGALVENLRTAGIARVERTTEPSVRIVRIPFIVEHTNTVVSS